MFYQNSEEMPTRVQRWGCYAAVISALTAGVTRTSLCQSEFVRVVNTCEEKGYLIEDPNAPGEFMYVKDPQGIFDEFGIIVDYLGKFPADYICRDDELEALLWKYKSMYHFTAGNGRGLTTYDPWAPYSQTASFGELRSKRVFRVRRIK